MGERKRWIAPWLLAAASIVGGCVPPSGGGDGDRPADDTGPEADAADPEADAAGPEADAGGDGGPDACAPACAGRACGDDGCGGVCGVCDAPAVCDAAGACVEPPAGCGDGRCAEGEDCAGCPADCGCPDDRVCTEAGLCEPVACEGEGCGAPPRILTFNANVRTLTEGGEVILSAVVTDPDGIADLIGGVLEDPGGASYAAFVTAGEEGAYGLTLSWDALHAVRPIEFDGEATRALVAVFFDQAGNRTSQVIELTLHCRDRGGAACDGACVSLESPTHCGACGAACDDLCVDRACVCPEGLTRCGGVCLDTGVDPMHCGACDNACPDAEGGAPRCVDGRCADPCPGAIEACDGVCVDVTSRADHCGDCDRVCQAPANGSPACRDSRCAVDCDPGRRLCGDACAPCPVEGVEGTACEGDACVALRCRDGFARCDGVCAACPRADVRETVCAGDRCVAIDCAPGTHPCAEGCCRWQTEVIDVGGVTFDMRVGPDGVHVVVGDREGVRYGRRVDGAWRWEPVYALDEAPQGNVEVSLALGPGGPYVALAAIYPPPPGGAAPSELVVLARTDDGWDEVDRLAGGGGAIVGDPSLATDGERLWLAFRRGPVHVVDLADGLAAATPVDELGGWEPHLVVAPDGALHLVFGRLFGDLIYAARPPGGEFAVLEPAAFGSSGTLPRVGIGADGHPLILHRDNINRLLTTRFDGQRWRTEENLRVHTAQLGHDVVRTPEGELFGCFGSQLGMFAMTRTEAGFDDDEIANGAGLHCRAGVAPDHTRHIVYLGDGGLTYAR